LRFGWISLFPEHVEFADYDWRRNNARFSNYLAVARDRPDLQAMARGR
jgi:hypothetical protein